MPVSKGPNRRTTMPLVGTVRHGELRLSFDALAATRLAVLRIARAHRLRPTLSAITRRALLSYVHKLEAMTPEELSREAHYVCQASKALTRTDSEAIESTLAGLEVSGEGEALPTLNGVLRGPSAPLDWAAMEANTIATLKAIHPRKYRDLKEL